MIFAELQPAHAVNPREMLGNDLLERRARHISKDIRCVVCQNQSIDDSDAPLASDLRVLIRKRLVEGDTDQEVISYLVSRYGDFVLLTPRLKGQHFFYGLDRSSSHSSECWGLSYIFGGEGTDETWRHPFDTLACLKCFDSWHVDRPRLAFDGPASSQHGRSRSCWSMLISWRRPNGMLNVAYSQNKTPATFGRKLPAAWSASATARRPIIRALMRQLPQEGNRAAVGVVCTILLIGSFGVYANLGSPDKRDLPLSARSAAPRVEPAADRCQDLSVV